MDLHDFTNSMFWDGFNSDRMGNQLFIDDPERADRCHEAAKDCANGSFHAEVIQDQRDALDCLDVLDHTHEDTKPVTCLERGEITEEDFATLHEALDKVEKWHEEHNTLWEEIG